MKVMFIMFVFWFVFSFGYLVAEPNPPQQEVAHPESYVERMQREGGVQELSLTDAIRLALSSNLEIAIEEFNEDLNREHITATEGFYDPVLNFTVGRQSSDTPSTTVLTAGRGVKEIPLQAETSQLFFPFYQGDQDNFSGFAFTNRGSETANIQLEGLGNDGTLLVFPTNPQSQQVGPQQQVARLGSEYFGTSIGTIQSGWIRIAATPDVSSLFLFGNGLNGPQTKMDGSVAFNAQSQVLFFTRIHDGPSTFPTFDVLGPQDAETFLSIVNPNDEEITITLKLFGSTGQPIAVTKAIFSQVANGRVNPQDPSSEMFTGLALFNRNGQSAQITIRVFDRDGNLAGETQITLGSNRRISDLVDNLIPATAELLRGYIVVESTQPMVAQQLFGNNTLQLLSAVPPRILNRFR